MKSLDPVELSLFASRVDSVCGEMGVQLARSAFSPNIRDRLDFSCALFDADGRLCAQAAHIPVHLGSMAYAMADIVAGIRWAPGDMVMLNDPFLGGTHLPDVTVVAPLFADDRLVAFVANRAHHADIGGESPGSMPLSRSLHDEGILIPPGHIVRCGELDRARLDEITGATRNPRDARGDFAAQIGANRRGLDRLGDLVNAMGVDTWLAAVAQLNDYGARLAWDALGAIPDGRFAFEDFMDDDGLGHEDIPIRVSIERRSDHVLVDFSGTARQVSGNINCPLSVTAAGVLYAMRCLMPAQTPACAGTFEPVRLKVPEGSLLNAVRPAAVAAGNVETSTRVVDVVLGALARAMPARIPAASHGSMNNVAMGTAGVRPWGYYETLGGGMGAGRHGGGLSAVQTHMTNTRNTPIEVLESRYPIRVRRYAVRRGSGGAGARPGGDGLLRSYEFLADARFTLLTERRRRAPWGLEGGRDGASGINRLNDEVLPPKVSGEARRGDVLTIETPGGGAYGAVRQG
ncbi:5-oxoprolinase [Thioalkalivibrio denitrificans]|uniref:5-oxoprolinase n=1 Tax=Thioalkalivibrio denitrificans TaxID=108003 RepID=A0A1V3NA56_9GAMM|nr:hydantoinase B/oxoprolinase family protein [Thioalkalivibrio denitrificans]OOG21987.1 5-oxoprolinase [Thioalkalivibrio denitrificans]